MEMQSDARPPPTCAAAGGARPPARAAAPPPPSVGAAPRVDAAREEAVGLRALRLREVVGDEAVARGVREGLAEAQRQTPEQHLGVRLRVPDHEERRVPDEAAREDDELPRRHVGGPPRDEAREAEGRREAVAREDAVVRVAQRVGRLDRREVVVGGHVVEVVEAVAAPLLLHVDEAEDEEDEPAIARSGSHC